MKQSLLIIAAICLLLATAFWTIHKKEQACKAAVGYCCKDLKPLTQKETQTVTVEPFIFIVNMAGYN